MTEKILNCGADFVKEIGVESIVFNPAFRTACKENKCGNYGKNYTCPPCCGNEQELINKVKSFTAAFVFFVTEKINGYEDTDGIKRAEQRIARIADKIYDMVSNIPYKEYYIIGGGPCRKCSPCKMEENKPCPSPEKAFISLSAFCIDTAKLAESCGVVQKWDGSEISYTGLLLVK